MDRMSSIELALKNEQTEMEFYLHEARRSKNPLAQTMFTSLAKDEEEHMTRIRSLHDKLVSDGSWPEDVPIEVQDTNVREVLDGMVKKQGSAADHDQDDEQALQRAADFEAKGAKFYSDLAEQCENPMEKNFFSFLSRIEKEHHLSVTDSLAYLRDPQAWMMEHERSGLDGA
jgi:rubrerythrin